jgi:hypothetical protein
VGANNHIRAQFCNILAKEVVNSRSPALFAVKSHVKTRKVTSWLIAFQILEGFLGAMGLQLTLEIFDLERPKNREKVNLSIILRLQTGAALIPRLIQSTARVRRIPVKDRIAEGAIGRYIKNDERRDYD